MSDTILRVENLRKHFVVGHKGMIRREPVTVKAVDGVSFEIQAGETVGLVGESGSGKSTIAYIAMGMYLPTSGTIYYRDRNLFAEKKRPLDLKREIQIVFQDPSSSLNPRQTVRQILELPLRIHQPKSNRLEEVVRLLDMVDLPAEVMHKYPRQLSGGERQIVAIARALATRPSLIVLDEPTSALDVSVQGKVINLLIRLQRDLGLTYLFISHDLSVMRNFASRVAILYLGRIAEVASTRQFFESPQHPYTQMLLSSIPVISEEEERLRPAKVVSSGEIPSPVNLPPGCSFHTRCPYIMDACKKVDPVLVSVGENGHVARCHLHSQPIGDAQEASASLAQAKSG
ncbi:MAG: ABC transporter ATP-binding protein [Chloroflexi bacterium]|nr:ABC transporter ATP-binding protein [Chloroflexota bacterium]